MQSIRQSFQVSFAYPVHFTTGLFDRANDVFARTLRESDAHECGRMLFVIDANVAALHAHLIDSIPAYCSSHGIEVGDLEVMTLPGGERVKNDPAHLAAMYEAIHRGRICRHSFVIAIGGGALLDLAGYAAATAHRGIRMVRVPTTVLSQNDSGVGVKSGINAFGKKNFIGAFMPPFAVLNDFEFLPTLDQRDWLAGTSEAVKVGLIRDPAFFDLVEESAAMLVERDMSAMKKLIHRCAELHLQHIATSGDPFESGSARPLDFGHWAAHKLEQMTSFQLRHGEAVGIGIALDATYSCLIGSLSQAELDRIYRCMDGLHLPLHHPAMGDQRTLLQGLEEFREHLGGRLTITMLRGIGKGYEVHEIDQAVMRQAIELITAEAQRTQRATQRYETADKRG